MSVWPELTPEAPLRGVEGDLLSVRLTVEAFLLEDLLEALAEASFPINPTIRHHALLEGPGPLLPAVPAVHVEFPAWRSQVEQVQRLVEALRFEANLVVSSMLEEIRT